MQHLGDNRRLLEKLVREIARAEAQATEHGARELKRIGEVPPVIALREIAEHAYAMRPRFDDVLDGYDIHVTKGSFGATLATLRNLVAERVVDPERAYRTALLDLRHGMDVVKLMRVVSRNDELFGLIRWCDDWLGARRMLVAHAEAELVWFADQEFLVPGIAPAPVTEPLEPNAPQRPTPSPSDASHDLFELK